MKRVDLAPYPPRGPSSTGKTHPPASRFVVSVARTSIKSGLSLADVINEGNLGLMKAATRFDESRGFKFISYAVWWIRQSILQALAEQSRIVRIPLNRIGVICKIEKTLAELAQSFEREPTEQELAQVLHISPAEIGTCCRIAANTSLDTSGRGDSRLMTY